MQPFIGEFYAMRTLYISFILSSVQGVLTQEFHKIQVFFHFINTFYRSDSLEFLCGLKSHVVCTCEQPVQDTLMQANAVSGVNIGKFQAHG